MHLPARAWCSETTAPTYIGPFKVPEGIVVWPMIYALQNSNHNWEQPEEFKPVGVLTVASRWVAQSQSHICP